MTPPKELLDEVEAALAWATELHCPLECKCDLCLALASLRKAMEDGKDG